MSYKRVIGICGFLLSLGLFLWIVLRSDTSQLILALQQIPLHIFVVLLLLQCLTLFLIAVQWKILFVAGTMEISLLRILKMNFIGTFFESVTPAMKSGGEGFKLLFLRKHRISMAQSTPILLAQKIYSFSCFIVLALLAFGFAYQNLSKTFQIWTLSGLFLIILIIIAFVGFGVLLFKRKKRSPFIKTFSVTSNDVMRHLRHNHKHHGFLIGISLAIWLLFAVKLYLILQVFNADISLFNSAYLTYIPYTVGLLPFSPGGLGTFEATMTYLLYPLWTTYSLSVVITVVFRFFSHWLVFIMSAVVLFINYVLNLRGEVHD